MDRRLDDIQKVLRELKFESNNVFLMILECILDFPSCSTETKYLRMELTLMFLEHLKSAVVQDYDKIFQDCEKLFVAKELKRITVESADIKEYYKLGEGDFGIVTLGSLKKADGSSQQVAIKFAKDWDPNSAVRREATVMSRLCHKNVIKLLAFQKGSSKLITEFMEVGNLKKAVQSCKFTDGDLLGALRDVAAGMEYVSGKKYVHRDLECGNVFVGSGKTCKIGDFELARFVGYNGDGQFTEKEKRVWFYHTAPEAEVSQTFSTKTDVWSYGVLVWEMYDVSQNLTPDTTREDYIESMYKFMSLTRMCRSDPSSYRAALNDYMKEVDDLMPKVFSKNWSRNADIMADFCRTGRLPHPDPCLTSLFDYVTKVILNKDPHRRPNFTVLKNKIESILSSIK